jgi:hypothetical protein
LVDKVLFSSKQTEWNTPKSLFLELQKEFDLNFDPCMPPIVGNFNGNGLKENWHGRAFLNPPYKRGLVKRWVYKTWVELTSKNIEIAVMLLPSRTDQDWFQFLLKKQKQGICEIRYIDERLHFEDAKGTKNYGAPFPSIIAILHPHTFVSTP